MSILKILQLVPIDRVAINQFMDWTRYETMDPHLLLGLVNTELRNHSESLDDLCQTHDIDQTILTERLASAGYTYRPEQGQFR